MATALAASSHDEPSFDGLVHMGDQLRRTGFLPSHIKDGVSFAAIVLMGRELGMGTMAACRKLQVIKGTVTERADSQLARFKSCGGRAQFKELTETRAVLVLRHPNGDEHTETFTIEDAKRAGLASNDNYAKHPKAMLRSRAITAGLKSIGWEGAVGIYDPDEVADAPTPVVPPEPAREPVVVRPKFPSPESAGDATRATDDDMRKARHYVQTATAGQLERMQGIVEERLRSRFYTPGQADELLNLINGKLDFLLAEPEDKGQEFPHEAAEHEVRA
ncbi:MAG: hypothetical protein EBR82_30185 [Caulobacteraceae bacterium]|nr:hypothetical protein [Caulobacteraceae bacterium]